MWGIHRDRWIPRTRGQLRGKCFHSMTSSCVGYITVILMLMQGYIDGLAQDCSNSSALVMELLQSCTKPSIGGVWCQKQACNAGINNCIPQYSVDCFCFFGFPSQRARYVESLQCPDVTMCNVWVIGSAYSIHILILIAVKKKTKKQLFVYFLVRSTQAKLTQQKLYNSRAE